MTTRLLVLAIAALALCGCASGQSNPPPTATTSPRARCLVDPNESGMRPLVFLFCIESP